MGIERFLASDADLAWIMDDDCVPAPDCLARLVDHLDADPQRRPVLPWWIDVATGEGSFLPAWCGFLISRKVAILFHAFAAGVSSGKVSWQWCGKSAATSTHVRPPRSRSVSSHSSQR